MVPGGGAAQQEDTLSGGDEAHPDSMATNQITKVSRTISLTTTS
jgi:hypothetical protein